VNKLIEQLDLESNKALREIIKTSKKHIKDDGACHPCAFLFSEKGVGMLPMPMDEVPKSVCFQLISKIAEETNSHMIVLVTEAWGLDGVSPDDESAKKIVDGNMSVSEHPDKKEMLNYVVMTPSNRWLGYIIIDSKNKKAEGTPTFIKAKKDNVQGAIPNAFKNFSSGETVH
jgi:hypothetical protein